VTKSGFNAGDIFRRKRGFCRPPEGYRQDHWWTATGNNPATHDGWEYVEIIEVISTATVGRLILHSVWWVDPDGKEVAPMRDWIPDKSVAKILEEGSLRRSLGRRSMEKVQCSAAPKRELVDLVSLPAAGSA
jgi:hypothetical protein